MSGLLLSPHQPKKFSFPSIDPLANEVLLVWRMAMQISASPTHCVLLHPCIYWRVHMHFIYYGMHSTDLSAADSIVRLASVR
jgi:hypothetical protein